MTSQRVSIITVTYNSATVLPEFWKEFKPTSDLEWIVVDNASRDKSAEVAEQLGARVIQLPRNVGFSAANNIGACASTAACFIFANPDVSLVQSEVGTLAKRALQHNALVAPQLLNPDGTIQENGRREPYLYRKLLHFFGTARSRQEYEVTTHPGEVKVVSWVIGAVLAISRSSFEQVAGWDSTFFIYYEDSDICLRAYRVGIPTVIDGNVRWVHGWDRATKKRFSLQSWRFEATSALRFYSRYPGLLTHPTFTKVLNLCRGRQ